VEFTSKEASPLISVLIPVYNREGLILETIQSAQLQDYGNFEIVVVDNCSTDNTYSIVLEIASLDTRIRLFRNEENLGPVKNWGVCLNLARGEFAKFLWSDDLLRPNFLKASAEVLEQHPEVGFVYTATELFSATESSIHYRFGATGLYPTATFIEAQLMGGIPVPLSPGNALFRLKELRQCFVTDIPNPAGLEFHRSGAGNDLLFFLGTATLYKYFYFIDEPLARFRIHDGSLSRQSDFEEYYSFAKLFFLKSNQELVERCLFDKYCTLLYSDGRFRYMVRTVEYHFHFLTFVKRKLIQIKILLSQHFRKVGQ